MKYYWIKTEMEDKKLNKLLGKLDKEYEKIKNNEDEKEISNKNKGYTKVELDTQLMLITLITALKKFKKEIIKENERTRKLIRNDIHEELSSLKKNNK
jgi:hypothetical protein